MQSFIEIWYRNLKLLHIYQIGHFFGCSQSCLCFLKMSLNVIRHLTVATTRIGFWTWIWSTIHWWLGQKVNCSFQHWFYWYENWLVCSWWKIIFKVAGFDFFLNWGTYIISIDKTVSKKIGVLIPSMKFLSLDVALYHCKSTIQSCMEHCCHVWAGAPNYYLELLDKLQKWICRTIGPSVAASLERLAHCRYWNVGITYHLFYRYCFVICLSELAELVPLPYSQGWSTSCSDRFHDFSVTIPKFYKDDYINNFFPHTARLWNYLHIEWFPLAYDLNGFKSRVQGFIQALLLTSVFHEGLSCGCRPQPIAHQQVAPCSWRFKGNLETLSISAITVAFPCIIWWPDIFLFWVSFCRHKACMVALSPHHLPPH